jgi:hypothetical protein
LKQSKVKTPPNGRAKAGFVNAKRRIDHFATIHRAQTKRAPNAEKEQQRPRTRKEGHHKTENPNARKQEESTIVQEKAHAQKHEAHARE